MNHVVAYRLLAAELNAYRELPFLELSQLVGKTSAHRKRGEDGVDYDLSAVVRWRLDVGGDVAITVSIGESSWGGPHDSLDDTIAILNDYG
jgi:hypothetical protein